MRLNDRLSSCERTTWIRAGRCVVLAEVLVGIACAVDPGLSELDEVDTDFDAMYDSTGDEGAGTSTDDRDANIRDFDGSDAASLPDVVVTSLSYSDGIFTSTVKNRGSAATPQGVAVAVGYQVDGQYRTWGGIPGQLGPGQSATVGTDGVPYTIVNGPHTVTAFADDVNRFAELDESNNKLSIEVGGGPTQGLRAFPGPRGSVRDRSEAGAAASSRSLI